MDTEIELHLNLTEYETSILLGGLIMIAEADDVNGYEGDRDTAVELRKQVARQCPAGWENTDYESEWETA